MNTTTPQHKHPPAHSVDANKMVAADSGQGLPDAALETAIDESDGYWREDTFCIDGGNLMGLLRTVAALATQEVVGGKTAESTASATFSPPQQERASVWLGPEMRAWLDSGVGHSCVGEVHRVRSNTHYYEAEVAAPSVSQETRNDSAAPVSGHGAALPATRESEQRERNEPQARGRSEATDEVSAVPVAWIFEERYGHNDDAWIERIRRELPVWEHRKPIPLYAAPAAPATPEPLNRQTYAAGGYDAAIGAAFREVLRDPAVSWSERGAKEFTDRVAALAGSALSVTPESSEPVAWRTEGGSYTEDKASAMSRNASHNAGYRPLVWGDTHPTPAASDGDAALLGKAIRDAAVAAGICRDDVPLTGPQLVMLCNDMAEDIKGRHSASDGGLREAFRVYVTTMVASNGTFYTVTADNGQRAPDATLFDSEGRIEIYTTEVLSQAEHVARQWDAFLHHREFDRFESMLRDPTTPTEQAKPGETVADKANAIEHARQSMANGQWPVSAPAQGSPQAAPLEPEVLVTDDWQLCLADALDCFWNPACSAIRNASYHGPASGTDVIEAIAQGLSAVASRLRE